MGLTFSPGNGGVADTDAPVDVPDDARSACEPVESFMKNDCILGSAITSGSVVDPPGPLGPLYDGRPSLGATVGPLPCRIGTACNATPLADAARLSHLMNPASASMERDPLCAAPMARKVGIAIGESDARGLTCDDAWTTGDA